MGRDRKQDLAPVPGGADPGRTVDVDPDQAGLGRLRLPGMDPDPGLYQGAAGPCVLPHRSLSAERGDESTTRGWEGVEQAVPGRVDQGAVLWFRSRGHQSAVVREEPRVPAPSSARRRVDPAMSAKSRVTVAPRIRSQGSGL